MKPRKDATAEKSESELIDWKRVAKLILASRAMDDLEEKELVPGKKVMYQFSARGHEMGQVILGSLITHKHDAVSAYYRSRPLMLSLGLSFEDALAAPMAKSGGYSDGRDIGVVCNMPGGLTGPTVLPMAGDVGSQYTPAAGWAQAIEYRQSILGDDAYEGAISVVLGGDASVATNGFWSSLTMATTLGLPMLFYIEDNGYGISVLSDFQTPGGNIANNLQSFKNLHIYDGNGTDPHESSDILTEAVSYVRKHEGPALVRLTMPRLNGHSYQDNQSYKSEALLKHEWEIDPLLNVERFLVPDYFNEREWERLKEHTVKEVHEAADKALSRTEPNTGDIQRYVFEEKKDDGTPDIQVMGGLAAENWSFPDTSASPDPEKAIITMAEAIRRTLRYELKTNPRLLIFGEDVGIKGGVHAVTMDLRKEFGDKRVFDTSLSEEGIIGRSVGLAYAGLMPVAEIQFRKYADPATEQLHNCGTIRWRTANKFAAPVVVRMPGGFAKCGDPWHSLCNEVDFLHAVGWQLAFPSNVEDAVGLLRTAMRSNNPTIYFEHRTLLDARWARRPYPGDQYAIPFGKASFISEGDQLTIVTWGAMVERCEKAVNETGISADIIDLRTLMPWDRKAVLESVKKTNRCLIVHEDTHTAGFGAEISASIMKDGFRYLDAPVERLTMPDIPVPHNIGLMNTVMPGVESISQKIDSILSF